MERFKTSLIISTYNWPEALDLCLQSSLHQVIPPDEILIALAISATTNPLARRALEQLSTLRGCEAHSTVILSPADTGTYSRLGLRLTCEPQYETNKLYHK